MKSLQRLHYQEDGFEDGINNLLTSNDMLDSELVTTVTDILNNVRNRGDAALVEYTNRFDDRTISISDLRITPEAMESACSMIGDEMTTALQYAADRIREYHQHQVQESWQYQDEHGSTLGQQVTAIEKAGIYVPGGKAVYPSSVLMNAIPAKVAGVKELIMTVPAPGNELNPLVLAAAHIAGVDYGFSIGGAQAIAALAFGTESVPKVDKITGPGNRYVAAAKRLVFGQVGIDMIAGPSEVVIISDGSTRPDWVALDMFAQAEHDEDARAILISTDAGFADEVTNCINELLPKMQRKDIIQISLEKNGAIILVRDLDMAATVSNQLAPEHLELAVTDADTLLDRINHAGAIFVGHWAAEVLGDYCAGPNHVLPTAGTARFSSPLGVYDFQKRSTVLSCSSDSADQLAKSAAVLATGEGLQAHAESARVRIKDQQE